MSNSKSQEKFKGDTVDRGGIPIEVFSGCLK